MLYQTFDTEPLSRNVLSDDQLQSFQENGFLAIDQVLNDEDLQPINDEYAMLLDDIAKQLVDDGMISETYADLAFGDRYSKIIGEYSELHRFFNISLPLINGSIDEAIFHMHAGHAVFDIMRHPKILDVVEDLIGGEIYSCPVQQMRMKPPAAEVNGYLKKHSNVGATTWHQDIVSVLPEGDETEMLTVWIAITDAMVENGCLVSVPGSHREGPKTHCSNLALASEPQVPGSLMEGREAIPLEVKRGGIVLFHKMNVHRALPNRSDCLRWSMDLRYHPTGQPTGRPAFPGFVARSRGHPESELRDPVIWAASWDQARDTILNGHYKGRLFEDTRYHDEAIC